PATQPEPPGIMHSIGRTMRAAGRLLGGVLGFSHAGERLAWELDDHPAAAPQCSEANDPPDYSRVLSWLQMHRGEIAAAEATFRVDRRAIAAAIAWEALENRNMPFSARAEGPGKVHAKEHWLS